MDEFVALASKNFEFKDELSIDGIPGIFSIEIKNNMIKFQWFDINFWNKITDQKREWTRTFKNKNELKDCIIQLSNLKFWKDEFINSEQYNMKFYFQKIKQEIFGQEPLNCYVCLEHARNYKTPCGHSICYACFIRSVKYVHEPTDGYQFKCGICRKIIFKDET